MHVLQRGSCPCRKQVPVSTLTPESQSFGSREQLWESGTWPPFSQGEGGTVSPRPNSNQAPQMLYPLGKDSRVRVVLTLSSLVGIPHPLHLATFNLTRLLLLSTPR